MCGIVGVIAQRNSVPILIEGLKRDRLYSDPGSHSPDRRRNRNNLVNTPQDIRWHQRYQQYCNAFKLLEQAICIQQPSVVERAGIIQFFEMAFELAWKLLKDYQQAEGFEINSPRSALKQAFQNGLIEDGHRWIQALDDRNLTTHTYNEATAIVVEQKIRDDYYPQLVKLRERFAGMLNS